MKARTGIIVTVFGLVGAHAAQSNVAFALKCSDVDVEIWRLELAAVEVVDGTPDSDAVEAERWGDDPRLIVRDAGLVDLRTGNQSIRLEAK